MAFRLLFTCFWVSHLVLLPRYQSLHNPGNDMIGMYAFEEIDISSPSSKFQGNGMWDSSV